MGKEFGGIEEALQQPPVTWLIPGWIPNNELSMLWGPEGTYKSFIALDWSLKLACQGKGVMYIVAEGLSGMRNRVAAWLEHNNKRNVPTWHYFSSNIYLNQKNERQRWGDALKQYLGSQTKGRKLNLIVVDTLDRCFDGEENSSREMGHFIDGLEALREEFGCAVLVIHHTRKDGKRERGTSALPAAVFASLNVRDPRVRAGGASVQLNCAKMKDAEKPKPLRIALQRTKFLHDITPSLEEVSHHSLVVTDSEEVKEAGESEVEAKPDRADIEILIEERGYITGEEYAEESGMTKKNANRKLWSLVQKGVLKKSEDGDYTLAD